MVTTAIRTTTKTTTTAAAAAKAATKLRSTTTNAIKMRTSLSLWLAVDLSLALRTPHLCMYVCMLVACHICILFPRHTVSKIMKMALSTNLATGV